MSEINVILPRPDDYAVGMFFLPRNIEEKHHCLKVIEKYFTKFGLKIITNRNVPIDRKVLGKSIVGNEPSIVQIFVEKKTFPKN